MSNIKLPEPYYQDESATIYHGDCAALLPTLLERSDVCVVTDPPYGIGEAKSKKRDNPVGGKGKGGRVIRSKDYGSAGWDAATADSAVAAIIDSKRKAVVFGGNYYSVPPSPSWIVWDKQNSGDFADCELAWSNHGGAVRMIQYMWNGMLRGSGTERDHRVHPTQKPVAVMEFCIGFMPDDAVIVDPFMGSGTTLVAARRMGRKAIGIEQDETYCRAAVERLAQRGLGL